MMDAFVTAEMMAGDLTSPESSTGDEPKPNLDIESLAQGHRVVSWKDWQLIDQEERRRGAARGKEREKMTSVQEMLGMLPR